MIWRIIDQYVDKYHMIEEGEGILLGLSGGADSVLLARYLLHLREQRKIGLYAVHVNHLLRGEEALRDQEFVRAFCEKHGIPLSICQRDVRAYSQKAKLSLEEAGREIRYQCFEELARDYHCQKIALAHHRDDLAETMIFRILRGTGPAGLSGILPIHENRIRPLLCVDKKEILWILSELKQDYVEDSSNQEEDYQRNYIRHSILPGMYQVNARAGQHMAELAEQLREQKEYLERQMRNLYEANIQEQGKTARAALAFMEDCSVFEQKEMIRRMLFRVAGRRKDITSLHVNMVLALLGNTPGKKCDLPFHMEAIRQEDALVIRQRPEKNSSGEKNVDLLIEEIHVDKIPLSQLEREGSLRICPGEKYCFQLDILSCNHQENLESDCVKYFDYDRIVTDLCFRTREQGDYFVMDREGRQKKLKRYFIDEKIPASEREHRLLLADGKHIMWIVGGRISESYKVTSDTTRILRIIIE